MRLSITSLQLLLSAVVVGLSLTGCSADASDGTETDEDLMAKADPCSDPQIKQKATVKRSADGKFIGTDGFDIIVGTEGKDIIFGNGGDDLICGMGGDDYIDGGDGRDHIFAGDGDDIVHGRGDSDVIHGGKGNDVLFGDILDDHLFGEEGNDILIGGHGTDVMFGGPDNDFMRGDTGDDSFDGGEGNGDVVSFVTAIPPGQPEIVGGNENPIMGVEVTFPAGKGCGKHDGCANGDGGNEPLDGVEKIIGSPYKDRIVAGGRKYDGSYGDDVISGTTFASPGATPASTVFIHGATDIANKLVDVGVVFIGSKVHDDIEVHGNGNVIEVTQHTGAALTAGPGCTSEGANKVRCDVGAFIASKPHDDSPFHYVAGYADDGNDSVEFTGTFPNEFETHVSGGEGDDHLVGNDEQDVFFTGPSGKDHLEGRGGDDALLSESHHDDKWDGGDRPKVEDYNDGADALEGGDGDDQLVADYVCGGHFYSGGAGKDIAGFARSGKHPIHAQLGGPAAMKTQWYGQAANMDLCGKDPAKWTHMQTGQDADLEILEGSEGPDYLWGDDRDNRIMGRAGGDHLFGLGGDDEILGEAGKDVIEGGPGHNHIVYSSQ
jgi:Ca2+-binding RTX toxin-like protein